MGEPNLSQAEQVSQGGEPTVDRGDPFGLLGYGCRQLKLERVQWAAEQFCEGSARSLHEPFDSPPCHHFPVQLVQPAASREFLDYFQSFPHARNDHFLSPSLILMCQLLRAPRAQQLAANLPRARSAPERRRDQCQLYR